MKALAKYGAVKVIYLPRSGEKSLRVKMICAPLIHDRCLPRSCALQVSTIYARYAAKTMCLTCINPLFANYMWLVLDTCRQLKPLSAPR